MQKDFILVYSLITTVLICATSQAGAVTFSNSDILIAETTSAEPFTYADLVALFHDNPSFAASCYQIDRATDDRDVNVVIDFPEAMTPNRTDKPMTGEVSFYYDSVGRGGLNLSMHTDFNLQGKRLDYMSSPNAFELTCWKEKATNNCASLEVTRDTHAVDLKQTLDEKSLANGEFTQASAKDKYEIRKGKNGELLLSYKVGLSVGKKARRGLVNFVDQTYWSNQILCSLTRGGPALPR
jgi:hypothetical protein